MPTAKSPLPDALDPGFHCARTQWIRGFMPFRLARTRPFSGMLLELLAALGAGREESSCQPGLLEGFR